MPAVSLLSNADDVVSSLTGLRRRILEALDQPASATGLAPKVGMSRQRLNYHMHALEDAGLVEVFEIVQRRGVQERVMRRKSDVVVVDPLAFTNLDLDKKDIAGLTGIVVTASDVIKNAALVAQGASAEGTNLATATVDTTIRVKSPSELRELFARMGELIASYNTEEGLDMRLATLALPAADSV